MPRRRREFSSAREAKEDVGSSPRNRPSSRRSAMLCGYCGPNNVLPRGYDYWETRYRCLQKGFGAGKFSERRKWQADTGQPIDPEYPSRCPHVSGNEGNGRRNRRGNRRNRRGSRSSRSSFHYRSSSDDEFSGHFGNRRSNRTIRISISDRNRRGARSSHRRNSRR